MTPFIVMIKIVLNIKELQNYILTRKKLWALSKNIVYPEI